ncbi:MAG: pyridoxamine 5'-phosphate oxidase family protein [Actinobacteria bacterium]|nr:pyridoxamine 5'-phosphate oxidase family protein [Actinomycetota bacterium]
MDKLSPLTDEECHALLRSRGLGRLGFTSGALPVVLPVNYLDRGDHLLLRTGVGPILEAAWAGQVACLEIDASEPVGHEGWSVLVTGRLHEIADPAQLKAVRALPLLAWARPDARHYVRLSIELLSGRRLGHDRTWPPAGTGVP